MFVITSGSHSRGVEALGEQIRKQSYWTNQLPSTNLSRDFEQIQAGLHKLWYPGIRDMSTWSKFGAHGEHGDVFLFSNLGAL